jgi:hypothetical protein
MTTARHPRRANLWGFWIQPVGQSEGTDDVWRAPSTGMSLTDMQWQKIRASLKVVGVDADVVMFGKLPLRQGLVRIAEGCEIESYLQQERLTSTPKQLAARQARTMELCGALLAHLDDARNSFQYNFRRHRLQVFLPGELVGRMRADLKTLIAKSKRTHDMLAMKGNSRGRKNRKLHNYFWEELTRVWYANVGKKKWTASVDLARFLFVCSQPFYPCVLPAVLSKRNNT